MQLEELAVAHGADHVQVGDVEQRRMQGVDLDVHPGFVAHGRCLAKAGDPRLDEHVTAGHVYRPSLQELRQFAQADRLRGQDRHLQPPGDLLQRGDVAVGHRLLEPSVAQLGQSFAHLQSLVEAVLGHCVQHQGKVGADGLAGGPQPGNVGGWAVVEGQLIAPVSLLHHPRRLGEGVFGRQVPVRARAVGGDFGATHAEQIGYGHSGGLALDVPEGHVEHAEQAVADRVQMAVEPHQLVPQVSAAQGVLAEDRPQVDIVELVGRADALAVGTVAHRVSVDPRVGGDAGQREMPHGRHVIGYGAVAVPGHRVQCQHPGHHPGNPHDDAPDRLITLRRGLSVRYLRRLVANSSHSSSA